MKKIFITLILLIAFSTIVNAAMDPRLKECIQRGYETTYDSEIQYCVFPDGNKCPLEDFNNELCGLEYKTEDYCVKESLLVWDKDKCCEGTEAYLPPNVAGQSTCRDISLSQKISDQFMYRPIFSITVIVILIIAVFIVFLILKKRK